MIHSKATGAGRDRGRPGDPGRPGKIAREVDEGDALHADDWTLALKEDIASRLPRPAKAAGSPHAGAMRRSGRTTGWAARPGYSTHLTARQLQALVRPLPFGNQNGSRTDPR